MGLYLLGGSAACRNPSDDGVPPPTDQAPTAATADTHLPTADTSDPCGPPAVELGNGATSHVPMGPTATLVHGVQGGWHIEVSGRVSGIGPLIAVHANIFRASDDLQLAGEQQPKTLELVPPDDCGGDFAGLQALLDDQMPSVPYQEFICSLVGDTLRVDLDVTDLDAPDRVATASAEVVATPDPYDLCP